MTEREIAEVLRAVPWMCRQHGVPRIQCPDGTIVHNLSPDYDAMARAVVERVVEPWERRAASLADTINQELRENGPLGVFQIETESDMREAVRLLVDLVRERYDARLAWLEGAARMMLAEAKGDVTGEYSSPAIRALHAALADAGAGKERGDG